MGLTTIRDIIAELNRQAAEHQCHRLLLIKQITTDPSYQASPFLPVSQSPKYQS